MNDNWFIFDLQFNDILNSVFSSAPTVALMVAIVLDNTLEAKISYSDRGFSWLKPFNRHDARNEEFYSFPIKVHEWIPTRFLDWLDFRIDSTMQSGVDMSINPLLLAYYSFAACPKCFRMELSEALTVYSILEALLCILATKALLIRFTEFSRFIYLSLTQWNILFMISIPEKYDS